MSIQWIIENTITFTYYLVCFYIIHFIYSIISLFYRIFFRQRKNLVSRYGANSWALVTGATDGIGKGFCEELCLSGFNLILVSRNEDKLNALANDLKKLNSNIETHVVVFDFSARTHQNDYKEVFEPLKNFDISILVNNVGIGEPKKFTDQDHKETLDFVNINCAPQVLLSNIFLLKLKERSSKSSIINISSFANLLPFPYFSQYASTKVFNKFFSVGLASEHTNMDILNISPLGVESKLSHRTSDGFFIVTPRQCAAGSLDSLGYDLESEGSWSHQFIGFFLKSFISITPQFITDYVVPAIGHYSSIYVKQAVAQEKKNKNQ